MTLGALALIDYLLLPTELRMRADLPRGRVKNPAGPSIASASRAMLLETDPALRREAIALCGSSITYGPYLDPRETLAARLTDRLEFVARPRPVFNLAQQGGGSNTFIPVAAALGTHPIHLLMLEVFAPTFAERPLPPYPPLTEDEIALLQAASEQQARLLAGEGFRPQWTQRWESDLVGAVRSAWRLYRLRGRLWWDPEFTPNYSVWSVRRLVAGIGLLPRRFHGQSTNIGKLPWRQAYRGGQQPSAHQRFNVPSARVHARELQALLFTARLAALAGVPVMIYEVPINLEFQRYFQLMDEATIARLRKVRDRLLARLRREGLEVIEAPVLPDDAFLDTAHFTPRGAALFAAHLARRLPAEPSPRSRRERSRG
jgi:hypothetical protein